MKALLHNDLGQRRAQRIATHVAVLVGVELGYDHVLVVHKVGTELCKGMRAREHSPGRWKARSAASTSQRGPTFSQMGARLLPVRRGEGKRKQQHEPHGHPMRREGWRLRCSALHAMGARTYSVRTRARKTRQRHPCSRLEEDEGRAG